MANSPPEPGKSFVASIHALRGIAALTVVWSHLVGMWLYESQTSWLPYTIFYNNLMRPFHLYWGLGHFGVAVFFLISGYIISLASETDGRAAFVVKRALRIFPSLVLAVLLMALVQWLLVRSGLPPIPDGHVYSWREIIGAATLYDQGFLGKNDVLQVTWTLVPEVVFYAVVAVIFPLMRRRPVASTLIVLFFGALLISFAPLLPERIAALSQWLVYFPMFVVGRLTHLVQSGRIETPVFATLLLLTAMIFVQAYEWQSPGILFSDKESIRAWSYVQAAVVFWLVLLTDAIRSRILAFFADISYSLYLLHIPVGYGVLLVTKDALNYNLALPLAVAASTGAATLSWRYVERPSQRMARRISRRFGLSQGM